jgi:uncharacterized membrane protein YdjX (TVP38/TMEM64 family)
MTSQIEHLVHGAGIGAPIAFVVIYAVLTVALVPGSVSSVAAGALFGALWGTLLTVAGATLGATGAFLIARRLGRAPLRARSGARIQRLDRWVAQHGVLAVLYVRLVSLFPFTAVNYGFGVTGVTTRAYVAATAAGIVPATYALVALGGSLKHPGSPGFVAALTMVLILALAAPLTDRALRRRGGSPRAAR